MSRPERIRQLGVVLCAACSLVVGLEDKCIADTSHPSLLQVSIAREAGPNTTPFLRVYVNAGTNKFAFVVPSGFRVDASNPEKILLTSEDYACFLTFRIREPLPEGTTALSPDDYRESLLREHPGAEILNEFSRSAVNHSGPAFDLEWKNFNGIEQSARLAFIPTPAGVLEFGLFSNPEKFSSGQPAFNSFLLSFYSNEGGKLRLPALSGQI